MISKRALVLALASLLCAGPASAGNITAAGGTVTVIKARTGKAIGGEVGIRVSGGDTVQTGPASYAVVALSDGSVLKLRAESQVVLAGGPKAKKITEVILKIGSLFSFIGKQAAGHQFRLRTPTAVAAVRGTKFFTALGKKKPEGQAVWLCVSEGAVDISSRKTKEKVTVPAGKGILIKPGGSLTDPQAYAWTEGLNWNMDAAQGVVEDTTKLDWGVKTP